MKDVTEPPSLAESEEINEIPGHALETVAARAPDAFQGEAAAYDPKTRVMDLRSTVMSLVSSNSLQMTSPLKIAVDRLFGLNKKAKNPLYLQAGPPSPVNPWDTPRSDAIRALDASGDDASDEDDPLGDRRLDIDNVYTRLPEITDSFWHERMTPRMRKAASADADASDGSASDVNIAAAAIDAKPHFGRKRAPPMIFDDSPSESELRAVTVGTKFSVAQLSEQISRLKVDSKRKQMGVYECLKSKPVVDMHRVEIERLEAQRHRITRIRSKLLKRLSSRMRASNIRQEEWERGVDKVGRLEQVLWETEQLIQTETIKSEKARHHFEKHVGLEQQIASNERKLANLQVLSERCPHLHHSVASDCCRRSSWRHKEPWR